MIKIQLQRFFGFFLIFCVTLLPISCGYLQSHGPECLIQDAERTNIINAGRSSGNRTLTYLEFSALLLGFTLVPLGFYNIIRSFDDEKYKE